MHEAVIAAKHAVQKQVRAGVTGEVIHKTTLAVIRKLGYDVGLPKADSPATFTSIQHGTGHGIGLCVHEPPLLDFGNPSLLVGDAITIEPGLYNKAVGGVRVEDVVIVTESGCINLGSLPEGLHWR
jgi:Xaa-Pro aminopeptidase